MVGGAGPSQSASRVEVYDPATGRWTSGGVLGQARRDHCATLLPGGKVLVVGGLLFSTAAPSTSAELYLEFTGNEEWRPLIHRVDPAELEHGTSITVTGARLRSGSEANGGNGHSSSSQHPLLSLSSVDTGRWVPLLGRNFSDTSVSATLPYVFNGPYWLHVSVQGVTASRMITLVNHTAPDTILEAAPTERVTRSLTALFEFSSAAGVSFECNLTGTGFSACVSPLRYVDLPEREHLFQVRALDLSGNADPTPAEFHWTVDRTNPDTSIESASVASAFTHDTSARFTFSSPEEASFRCGLNGADFAPCPSPKDFTGLAEGEYTLRVKAIDRAENEDPTPAEFHWTVDTTPPQRSEIAVPTSHQELFTSQPVFQGTAEPGSTVTVFVDGTALATQATANEAGAWELVSPPLPWGPHQAAALATDLADNSGAASVEVSFATVQQGHYGLGCATASTSVSSWLTSLLALGLWRRRRSPPVSSSPSP